MSRRVKRLFCCAGEFAMLFESPQRAESREREQERGEESYVRRPPRSAPTARGSKPLVWS